MGILPDVEKEKHDTWYKAKMICNDEFISKVKKWLLHAEQALKGQNDCDNDDNDGDDYEDDDYYEI